jgi:hypothetical protein
LWLTISHPTIAAIDRIVAAVSRHGPMVADSCQIVGYAKLTAPLAKAAIMTRDMPAASLHGRFA